HGHRPRRVRHRRDAAARRWRMIDLRGKHALVTGGSRGVGRATARLLARAGADVGIAYRDRSTDAEETVNELKALGVRAWAHAADIADEADVERLFERAAQEF